MERHRTLHPAASDGKAEAPARIRPAEPNRGSGLTRALQVAHFPAPATCPACGKVAAFWIGAELGCTSQECDPHGLMFMLLDRWYRSALQAPDDGQAAA